jgi:uncharacterized integral membrane protein
MAPEPPKLEVTHKLPKIHNGPNVVLKFIIFKLFNVAQVSLTFYGWREAWKTVTLVLGSMKTWGLGLGGGGMRIKIHRFTNHSPTPTYVHYIN